MRYTKVDAPCNELEMVVVSTMTVLVTVFKGMQSALSGFVDFSFKLIGLACAHARCLVVVAS